MDWSAGSLTPEEASGISHSCPDCSFQTASLRKLGRHRSVNHAGIKYKCEHCDFVTGYQSNYYRHRKQVHSGAQSSLACPKCDFFAASNEGLTVHMSQMHKEEWECLDCGVQLNTKSQWQEHNRTYHGRIVGNNSPSSSSHPPATEEERQKTMQALQIANSAKMAELMTAAFLPFMQAMLPSMNLNLLNQTLTSAQQNNPPPTEEPRDPPSESPSPSGMSRYTRNYVCTYNCGFGTRESRDYLHHLRDVHGEKLQIFYCDKCSYASKFLGKVKRHQLLIHRTAASDGSDDRRSEETPASDESEDGDNERALLIDVNQETKGVKESSLEKLKCDSCPYQTDDIHRYKKHIRCHQTTADTKCKFCDFQTVYSWNLDRHVRCHNIPGRYTCMKCSFSQNTRQSMSFHLLHHHVMKTVDAETQTETDLSSTEEIPFSVSVEAEPYIWETHAVRFNPELQIKHQQLNGQEEKEPEEETGLPETPRRTEESLSSSLRMDTPPSGKKQLKRYLSEHDAIQAPTDEKDMKDLEKDPDIQSRTCSICGYQGKWISEMIRHKRVHTNERPFRCKYCSRTSKWKADLIRHVAKVHNIRVVSKYSRSKTFDSDPTVMRALKEAHGFMDQDSVCEDKSDPSINGMDSSSVHKTTTSLVESKQEPSDRTSCEEEWDTSWEKYLVSGPSEDGDTIYWCKVCSYETRDIHLFKTHTSKHESKRPFQCSVCSYRSNWSSDVYKHIRARNCGNGTATVVKYSPSRKNTGLDPPAKWRCALCAFEALSEEKVIEHLKLVHDSSRFGCGLCKFHSFDRKTVGFHLRFQHQNPESKIVDQVIDGRNWAETTDLSTKRKVPSPTLLEQTLGGILKKGKFEKKESISASSATSVSSLSFPESPRINSESPEMEKCGNFEEDLSVNSCDTCPYKAGNSQLLATHRKGHEKPKGLINYRCVYCPWYSKKKQSIFDHMLVHTDRPEEHAEEVERNLITPLSQESQETTGNTPNQAAEETKIGIGDVSEVMSDFSAILHAAGEDLNLNEVRVAPMVQFQQTLGLGEDRKGLAKEFGNETSDSEPEIGDEEAYIHAGEDALDQGLEFVRQAPREIQKVSVFAEGEMRKMWKCRFCEHTSKRRANVRSHEKKHFKKNPVGLLRCPRCSYRGDKRSLNAHFRVHSGSAMPERFPCSKCPANFRSRQNLVKHMQFHGGNSEFKCSVCDYAVTAEKHLVEHGRVHSFSNENEDLNVGKLSDSVQTESKAKAGFTSKEECGFVPSLVSGHNSVDFHSLLMAKQNKPKRYTCTAENCGAKFSDNTQLKRHEQYHSNEKKHPHKCLLCNYSVPYAINLIKHLRSHHDIPIGEVAQMTRAMQSTDAPTVSDRLDAVESSDEEDNARVTPDGEPGSLKIKISLGKSKV